MVWRAYGKRDMGLAEKTMCYFFLKKMIAQADIYLLEVT